MTAPLLKDAVELDPHWEWCEVTTVTDREPVYVKTRCKHREKADVTLVLTGDLVARLCLTCDVKFYLPWVTDPL
jgi:hypothetical protein